MTTSLQALLLEQAGEAAYQRGLAYAREGRIRIETSDPAQLRATAHGTHPYRLELRWQGGQLQGGCECPIGQRNLFCKHQVAAALLWQQALVVEEEATDAAASDTQARRPRPQKDAVTEAALDAWLQQQPEAVLRGLLLSLAAAHPEVARELRARVRMAGTAASDGRKAVSELIGRSRSLDRRDTRALANRLQTLLDLLRDHLQTDPARALDLADHALHRLIAVYACSDDSNGALGAMLREVGLLHAQAARCLPDLDGFGKSWLKLQLADDWGLVGGVDVYSATLGRRGLAGVEAEIDKRLSALPPAVEGRRWGESEQMRRRLLSLLEELARHGGDIDALLTLRERASLVRPDDYMALSRLCGEHGRERLALQWLERGAQAFPRDTRLLGLLAQACGNEGFADEALELAWRRFELEPCEAHFLALRELAGATHWPRWRERALAHVQAGQAPGASDDSLLVRLHLAEQDVETIVALLPGARLTLAVWMQLVPALSAQYPAQALAACQVLLRQALETSSRVAYREVVDCLLKMQALHVRLGDTAGFAELLTELRTRYRARRSFIEMLEAAFPPAA